MDRELPTPRQKAFMANIQHILFPYDFSKAGQLASRFVRTTAQKFDAKVTLMAVMPPIWNVPPMGVPGMVMVDEQQMETELKARLDRALTAEFAGLCVQRLTDRGDPAVSIVEFARTASVDLIMMPTHGFGIFRGLLIGSVTAKVLHDAKCPVWTATHAEEQHARDLPGTVVCAVDGGPRTCELIQWAAKFSRQMGSSLKLLHVVPPISDWLTLPSERELQEQVREEARTKIERLRAAAGVDVPLRVAVGPITETVTEESRQEAADLVIVGRGTLQATLGRLRTHAYGIVQTSPCPVLSV